VLQAGNEAKESRGQMFFFVQDGLFLIKNESSPAKVKGRPQHIWTAFNGSSFQRLNFENGYMYVKETDVPEKDPLLKMANDFLRNYEFFPQGLLQDDWTVVKLEHLRDPAEYAALLARCLRSERGTQSGKDCVIADFEGGQETFTGLNTIYRVYFSTEEGGYPFFFKRIAPQGQKNLYEVEVTKMGNATVNKEKAYYPIQYVRRFYGGTEKFPYTGKVVSTITVDVEEVQINPAADPDFFMIDPSFASSIWDANHQVLLRVPK
jgi:hypothetical protein